MRLTDDMVREYKDSLEKAEKSKATIEKYMRDIIAFGRWVKNRDICREVMLEYKAHLVKKYAARSVNSILSSLNSLFDFLGMHDCKVKTVKIQKQIFYDKELTREEYLRLLNAAKKNKRLYFIMQTICSTGIRVSELEHITHEAVKYGKAEIRCKGKIRTVILTKDLCRMLKGYMKERNIKSGAVFVTRTGKPLDRSSIWAEMKKLCKKAGVKKEKVFPHNLRHLFARTFYSMQKDIVRLADILGHSSIDTTRIYTMESGDVHRRQIEKMKLLVT